MLNCDNENGLCEIKPDADVGESVPLVMPEGAIWYVTDPICSHCWALEPAWRKLLFLYGERIETRHIYGGLLPGWEGFSDPGAGISSPADVVPHWEEVALHYGQPINPVVWLNDPLHSSYPACIACHAARLLAPEREEAYLRRIRDAVFLEARNIARPEILAECAADVGLDPVQFMTLFSGGAAEAAFRRDQQEMRRLPVRGFPTLIFQGKSSQALALSGTQPFAQLEQVLLQVTGLEQVRRTPTVAEALAAYGSGSTLEYALLLDVSPAAATKLLEEAGAIRQPVASDALWVAPSKVSAH